MVRKRQWSTSFCGVVFWVCLQILSMLEVILTMADEIQSMETSVLMWKDKMWLLSK